MYTAPHREDRAHRARVLLPVSLTVLRILLGPLAIFFAERHLPRILFGPLLLAGLLSDIYDGVIARRLGVATPWLRRFDSAADVIYYLFILWATWLLARDTLRASTAPAVLLVGSEVLVIVTSLLRFRVLPATHCYSAKIYGLALFSAFLLVLSFSAGPWVFRVLAVFGLGANLEVIAILFLSVDAPVDVLSIRQLRRRSA